ncbi:uncharacterized protein BO66DRAFT_69720 [Aspergillus aculeatinus CBS 121060]|uniref:Uncharacterized protein n=1 Tax=Aspergillus aculeatinus CBS 121060 TaxID=1448322 RepID=A0ACD1HMS9_9EURO|nr:hypothetical protein BO66DRAFT_69720 [Aspergillus aculeatinus CBS 121060]RAH74915.1 hypothetical protein BO66DRAFT_69720 [Aspergillus aculeatinus CBS 121060]
MISFAILVLLALPCLAFTWSRKLRGYTFDSLFRWKSHTPTAPSTAYLPPTCLSIYTPYHRSLSHKNSPYKL